ncbi:hypothetical protein AM1_G0099 (plasmid) [Acaryochloris marina MBIC11017]|uniref:Uncharacterized protein n=1 Tax=Acaryochloris marina (strain MBIC 11017) TaxID=329726 RepID=A8ZQJ3_ACAM1|nr:hypothetical protein AM1_G0099 [Acaryochloris marina MBIC11017]
MTSEVQTKNPVFLRFSTVSYSRIQLITVELLANGQIPRCARVQEVAEGRLRGSPTWIHLFATTWGCIILQWDFLLQFFVARLQYFDYKTVTRLKLLHYRVVVHLKLLYYKIFLLTLVESIPNTLEKSC